MKNYWVDAGLGKMKSVSYSHTPSILAKSAFFYLQSAGQFWCNSEYYTRREGYNSILLIYTVSGSGYAFYRGKEYELKAGQVLLMDCYDYQEYRTGMENNWNIKWIHFYGSTSQEYYNIIYDRHGAVIDIQDSGRIQAILDEILRTAETGEFLHEARTSLLIARILTELLYEGSASGEDKGNTILAENIKQALEYVENNYSRYISLSDMALHACCSKYHFSRAFKKMMGYSPYEYIVKYRVNIAKGLLTDTDMPVGEIAESVGFGSTSNFIRTFRALEGITPLKYRSYWK